MHLSLSSQMSCSSEGHICFDIDIEVYVGRCDVSPAIPFICCIYDGVTSTCYF